MKKIMLIIISITMTCALVGCRSTKPTKRYSYSWERTKWEPPKYNNYYYQKHRKFNEDYFGEYFKSNGNRTKGSDSRFVSKNRQEKLNVCRLVGVREECKREFYLAGDQEEIFIIKNNSEEEITIEKIYLENNGGDIQELGLSIDKKYRYLDGGWSRNDVLPHTIKIKGDVNNGDSHRFKINKVSGDKGFYAANIYIRYKSDSEKNGNFEIITLVLNSDKLSRRELLKKIDEPENGAYLSALKMLLFADILAKKDDDYKGILCASECTDKKHIKKSYKELLRICHPNKNVGEMSDIANEASLRIINAYENLPK